MLDKAQQVFGAFTRAGPAPSYEIGDWLDRWYELELSHEERATTVPTVRRILQLLHDVDSTFGSSYRPERDRLVADLERAGNSLARGMGTDVAEAIADAVQTSINQQRTVTNALRALLMLAGGVAIQGAIITFAVARLAEGKLPEEFLGVKTLTFVALLVSGVAGSLARAVFDALYLRDAPSNLFALAITVTARPLLAAVLVLFVFSLFQFGLLGTPFEAATSNPKGLVREDFFYIAISFVVGFNDTLGLRLLSSVSGFLQPRTASDQSPPPRQPQTPPQP